MSDPIIRVEGLSKKYTISHEGARGNYSTLRDAIANKARSFVKKKNTGFQQELFWALNNVSFEINRGEAVGVIGRNGAGKSTLLKVLSRITEPTSGRIEMNGRVASLLEVGTGFHPELTGRENIYLNGAILGMSRSEIRKKFDEIVGFSGVERFLDTPVKRYSSGMSVRLAFAVAAHLEPEILIIDEVLAVGDAEFQKKCLQKMEDVSTGGKTVIFVSHDMNAVERLCSNTIVLEKGTVVDYAGSASVISKYLAQPRSVKNETINLIERVLLKELSFSKAEIQTGGGLNYNIKVTYEGSLIPDITDFCLLFYTIKGLRAAIFDLRPFLKNFIYKEHEITFHGCINDLNLIEGEYSIGIHFGIDGIAKDIYDIATIRIKPRRLPFTQYDAQYRGIVDLTKNYLE
jgi:lipopolysaccharide transport system ATP-binding protein